jgi:hypothetical protein
MKTVKTVKTAKTARQAGNVILVKETKAEETRNSP